MNIAYYSTEQGTGQARTTIVCNQSFHVSIIYSCPQDIPVYYTE